MTATRSKQVSLTVRGFAHSVDEVERLFVVPATKKGTAGEPVKPGATSRLTRSFVKFAVPLNPETRLDEVVPKLLEALGGLHKISSARREVSPDYFEIDITWPIKGSDEQEGGYFSKEVLANLSQLECTLSFSFL